MEDPARQIEHVVRSLVELPTATEIVAHIDKYFTKDARILHPLFNQPLSKNGREDLKGIYKMERVLFVYEAMDIHSIMTSQDKKHIAIDSTVHITLRYAPFLKFDARFVTICRLVQAKNGRWLISEQTDILPSDLSMARFPVPILRSLSDFYKHTVGYLTASLGRFLLKQGWGGA
ncbi:uncharacterized protein EI90DRAFT_3012010 [Cantharellus anzutake]|uniref:uncharacterized protein n=1 Tax=Cantharellus anzutake TaxID=1750568 RepID=UPI001906CC96|nr:uncharacterized protein EI90DRAFT_3012010 [Cantharellus anzutake]KAF8341404.1 hypothetical protein EI90DRAFT_3012010 [Cantharellus anzutake]